MSWGDKPIIYHLFPNALVIRAASYVTLVLPFVAEWHGKPSYTSPCFTTACTVTQKYLCCLKQTENGLRFTPYIRFMMQWKTSICESDIWGMVYLQVLMLFPMQECVIHWRQAFTVNSLGLSAKCCDHMHKHRLSNCMLIHKQLKLGLQMSKVLLISRAFGREEICYHLQNSVITATVMCTRS